MNEISHYKGCVFAGTSSTILTWKFACNTWSCSSVKVVLTRFVLLGLREELEVESLLLLS